MSDDSFEIVYQAATELDASIGKALLEDAGIKVVVLRKGEVWRRWYFGEMTESHAQLLVPSEDANRAKALLADYIRQVESGAFELQDEEAPE